MKTILDKLIFLLVSLIFINDSLYGYTKKSSPHFSYVEEITKIANQEIPKLFGVYPFMGGGSMPNDVEVIHLDFISYKPTTIEEARILEVLIISKVMNIINSHPKIAPYLREYPFPAHRVNIGLSFCNPETGYDYAIDSIAHVFQTRGNIYYSNSDLTVNELVTVLAEPYQDALKIVQKELLTRDPLKLALLTPKQPIPFETTLAINPPKLEIPSKEYQIPGLTDNRTSLSLSASLRELLSDTCSPYFNDAFLRELSDMEAKNPSGEYILYWLNGKVKFRGKNQNGLAEGHAHGWYPDGLEAFKGFYKSGRKVGVQFVRFPYEICKFLRVHARMLNYSNEGLLDGEQTTDDSRGNGRIFINYDQGLLDGECIFLATPRERTHECTYSKGKLIPKPLKSTSKPLRRR